MAGLTPHSSIGASSCERWWNCPGSVDAVAVCPPQQESPYAAEGTAAHELGEICLNDGSDAINHLGEFSKKGWEFTDEMCDAVQVYLDTIRADMKKYKLTKDELRVEHKFHLAAVDANAYGTNDACLLVFPTKVIVYDYKHGAGVAVDAEDNKQMAYYAIGAEGLCDADEFELVIVQPRAIHRDGPVRRWKMTLKQLKLFQSELKGRISFTRSVDARRVAGPWCKKTFCPAMATCPEVRKEVETTAMTVFSEQPVAVLPKPESLTPLQLRRVLEGMPLMEEWLKAVWSYAEQKANSGEAVDGFKLVRGREGNRKWADPVKVGIELGPLTNQLYKRVLSSPAELEKLLGKPNKKLVDALTTRSEGKIILVPASDPRLEVSPNATKVFAAPDTIEELM